MILIHQYLQNLININFEKGLGKLLRFFNLPLQAFPYLRAAMAYVGDVLFFLVEDCGDLPLLR